MGMILTPVATWNPSVDVPIPGQPVRAGGAAGTAITIPGNNNNANGGVTYSALVAGVRVQHLGGFTMALSVTVVGSDITVQLGTNGFGVVTSTANAVLTALLASGAAMALVTASVTGTGAGLAGEQTGWVNLTDGVQGSILPMEQALTDRTEALYSALQQDAYEGLVSKAQIEVTGAALVVQAMGRLAFNTSGGVTFNWRNHSVDTVVAGPWAFTAWQYIYAYDTGAAVGIEVSSTAPDTARALKTGDTTRRYVGCFKTSGAGWPTTQGRMVRGHMMLDSEYTDVVLAAGPTGGWVGPVSCTGLVPSHVRAVDLWCSETNIYVGAGSGSALLALRAVGSSLGGRTMAVGAPVAGQTLVASDTISLNLSDAQTFEWNGNANVDNTRQVSVFIAGWWE